MAIALLIEPQPAVIEPLTYFLERLGMRVVVASDRDAVDDAAPPPSVVVLDASVRSGNRRHEIDALRSRFDALILVLGRGRERPVNGAPAVILPMPFTARDLASRVGVLAAPDRCNASEVLSGGPVHLDIGRHVAWIRGTPMFLRVKEFDLLEVMLRRQGQLLTRPFLLAAVWGIGHEPATNTLEVHILRLRQKVEADPHHPRHILTRRGRGYCFVDEADKPTPVPHPLAILDNEGSDTI